MGTVECDSLPEKNASSETLGVPRFFCGLRHRRTPKSREATHPERTDPINKILLGVPREDENLFIYLFIYLFILSVVVVLIRFIFKATTKDGHVVVVVVEFASSYSMWTLERRVGRAKDQVQVRGRASVGPVSRESPLGLDPGASRRPSSCPPVRISYNPRAALPGSQAHAPVACCCYF